jgi:hypothetical protein
MYSFKESRNLRLMSNRSMQKIQLFVTLCYCHQFWAFRDTARPPQPSPQLQLQFPARSLPRALLGRKGLFLKI